MKPKPPPPSQPITTQRSHFPPEDVARFHAESEKILAGRLSMGPWVKRFEEAACRAHEAKHAVATSSCTAALEIALLCAGIEPGDAVVVPAETFIATGMAVANIGARPAFADIRAETLCLDPAELARLAEQERRIKAVIVVHFAGLITPDIEQIQRICRERGWTLIEDAAHAHGAKFDGRSAGAFGQSACFSYYPTKVLTAGEGGMLVARDDRIAAAARSYQARGQDLELEGEQFARPFARNVRLPELSALLGTLQYGRLDEFVARRRAVATVYHRELGSERSIQLPTPPPECRHNYWLYPVILPPGSDRAAIKRRMKDEWQIDVSWSYFPPLHLMPVFRSHYGTAPGMLPVAEDVLARLLCLPVHPLISEEDAARVAACFLDALAR